VYLAVIDLTFIHQRPQAIAMVWSVVGSVSPAVLSFSHAVNPTSDWRKFYYMGIIPTTISFLLVYFVFTETYFTRPTVAFDGHIIVQNAAEEIKIYDTWEAVPGAVGVRDVPKVPGQGVWKWSTKELKFWGKTPGGWNAMFACYPQILLCLLNPLVFWVTLLQAAIFGSMLSLGQTYVQVLRSEPYNLPPHAIGLVNVARALGSALAWPSAGIMVTHIMKKLAMANKGVKDAEHYLPAFVLPILTGAGSVTLYGITVQHKWHWIWVYVAYVLNAFSFSAMATASTLVSVCLPSPLFLACCDNIAVIHCAALSRLFPLWIRIFLLTCTFSVDHGSFPTLGSTSNGSRQRHQLHRQLWHKFQYPTLGEITRILWR